MDLYKLHRPKPTYKTQRDVVFTNKINGEAFRADLVNEENIDGKQFYVVRRESRTLKILKEVWSIKFAR